MKQGRTKDFDLRAHCVAALLGLGLPREAIRHEITFDTSSSGGRADIVVLREEALIGIEIKSGSDTLDRLALQGPAYRKRFDHTILVHDDRHTGALAEMRCSCLAGWELLTPDHVADSRILRATIFPRGYFHRSGDLSPARMLSLLWASEIRGLGQCNTRWAGIDHMSEVMPLRDIRKGVAGLLRTRSLNLWEDAFWCRFDALQQAPA